jgi:hypothetical protein
MKKHIDLESTRVERKIFHLGSASGITRGLSTGKKDDGSSTSHNNKWDPDVDIKRDLW